MSNIKITNTLDGITLEGDLIFNTAKNELSKNYNREILLSLLNYLKAIHLYDECIRLTISILKDEHTEHEYLFFLYKLLKIHFPYNTWKEHENNLLEIPDCTYWALNKNGLIKLATILEKYYARGITSTKKLLGKLFSIINYNNYGFVLNTAEEVHLQCAEIAYNCNEYNAERCIKKIKKILKMLGQNNKSDLKYIADYYLGICILQRVSGQIDAEQHIRNSAKEGFNMAKKFVKHFRIHFETSNE